jgi:CBS domain-containing protein
MSLHKFCQRPVVTISPEDNVLAACKLLRNESIGCVVAVENGKPCGILTDRDIALNVAGNNKDPERIKVRDMMTPKPVSIPVNRTLSDLTTVMHTYHVRRVPIVDEHDKVVGLVTLDDLLVLLSNEMGDMRESISGALFRPPVPIEHLEALPLDWITSYL